MKITNVTCKSVIIKKGKEVFGGINQFNLWLNTENDKLGCKPITVEKILHKSTPV